jgi:hypothetical protein
MALSMVGSACGSPGEGIAVAPGPRDRVPSLALQPVGFLEFRLGGAADQHRLPVWLAWMPCAWRMPLARAFLSPPDSGMWMMRGLMGQQD